MPGEEPLYRQRAAGGAGGGGNQGNRGVLMPEASENTPGARHLAPEKRDRKLKEALQGPVLKELLSSGLQGRWSVASPTPLPQGS